MQLRICVLLHLTFISTNYIIIFKKLLHVVATQNLALVIFTFTFFNFNVFDLWIKSPNILFLFQVIEHNSSISYPLDRGFQVVINSMGSIYAGDVIKLFLIVIVAKLLQLVFLLAVGHELREIIGVH